MAKRQDQGTTSREKTRAESAKKIPKKRNNKRRVLPTKYTEASVQEAIELIRNGELSKKKASLLYGIPRQTLQYRMGSKFSHPRRGPLAVLTEDEEKLLVKWLEECGRKGFPKRQLDLLNSVEEFLKLDKDRKTPFTNGKPGKSWMKGFLSRHPEIAYRTPEAVTAASSNVSSNDLKKWFQIVEDHLEEEGCSEVLSHPERIFNGDETNFLLCPKTGRVLTKKGTKNVYEVDCGTAKSAVTVMFTFSAAGDSVTPMLIYPYVRLPKEIIRATGLYPWDFSAIDLSKCLGSSHGNTKGYDEEGAQMPNTLDFRSFRNMAGPVVMKRLTEGTSGGNPKASSEFETLVRKIYAFFGRPGANKDQINILARPDCSRALFVEPLSNGREEELGFDLLEPDGEKEQLGPICDDLDLNGNEANVESMMPKKFSQPCLCNDHSQEHSTRSPSVTVEVDLPVDDFEHLAPTDEFRNTTKECSRICSTMDTIEALPDTSNEYQNRSPKAGTVVDISNPSTLREVLHWPTTPKRKGKRVMERMPYGCEKKDQLITSFPAFLLEYPEKHSLIINRSAWF
ncbi:hypothetical protein GE061_006448 [Apolygus lucorum]|uniref:HTH CENPB-type domain-containing protein n=1 Tax=Apolygus lucorum TaxID=248454 RepID=A0A8S9WU01_APOLU|nr:hypothetical protein GE061_006448 [Apolygus lucorum]